MNLIFVTVGTHNEPFDRLLSEMDKLVGQGKINGKVVAQVGYSKYIPQNFQHFRFTSWKKILKLNRTASIVVTHGGAGNLILASHFGKKIVAVPRMRKYREHIDDHQVQLVRQLEKERRLIAVYDIRDLSFAVKKSYRLKTKKGIVDKKKKKKKQKQKRIVSIIENYLSVIEK